MNESDHSETKRTPRYALAAVIPVLWVAAMWVVYLLEVELDLNLKPYGLVPRDSNGLVGIATSPMLHGSMEHLINNSIPALVLGWSLFYFYKEISLRVLVISWVVTGLLVWISARPSVHIGASGVVYALTAFLFVSGFLRKHKSLMAISFIVTFLYGSFIWGVLPLKIGVSWESHLWGGIIGVVLAIVYRKIGLQKPVHDWGEEDDDEDGSFDDSQRQVPVTIIYHPSGSGPIRMDPGTADSSD
jgi:membrane associated rhomboid family serine protease